jgi:hypothetical protein
VHGDLIELSFYMQFAAFLVIQGHDVCRDQNHFRFNGKIDLMGMSAAKAAVDTVKCGVVDVICSHHLLQNLRLTDLSAPIRENSLD